jgi:hypothetical protein
MGVRFEEESRAVRPQGTAERVRQILDRRHRLQRIAPVTHELLRAGLMVFPRPGIVAVHEGAPAPEGPERRLLLYAHFSASNRVQPAVLAQLREYHEAGYTVAFATMAPDLAAEAIVALRATATLVVVRRSFGRDFGAWKDLLPLALARWPTAGEVLLANDSVLGPLRPVAPVLERMRGLGDGMTGLTESRSGPPHLQSYFLLIRGRQEVALLTKFLAQLQLSGSKWLMVRRGEYALTRWMVRRDVAVRALILYEEVRRAAVAAGRVGADASLNPMHQAWDILLDVFGCPFVKRDLLRTDAGVADEVRKRIAKLSVTGPTG